MYELKKILPNGEVAAVMPLIGHARIIAGNQEFWNYGYDRAW